MSVYRIKMNGKTYEMEVELVEEGKRYENKKLTESASNRISKPEKSAEIRPGTVTSPMPGSVIEVCAKPGQKVSEGEAILVLETMKMENEILAPKTGTIKDIFVSEGQTVASETPLFEMEG